MRRGFFLAFTAARNERMTDRLRITLLIADADGANIEPAFRHALLGIAPDAVVRSHAIGDAALAAGRPLLPAPVIDAAVTSGVTFVLAPRGGAAARTALIALREAGGYTERFAEPAFARMWRAPAAGRDLFVVGALPGGLGALELAAEHSAALVRARAARLAISA